MTNELKAHIIAIARSHDVDLIGFARVADIELGYPARPANALLPGAKTAIALAAALLRGALDCPRGTKGAVKDAQMAYDRMEQAGAAVGRFLEAQGFASYMPPASMPTDAFKHKGTIHYAAEWSHRQAAIAASLGVKGLNNLLITPEFGPRVRLGGLLTTAEIEPDRRELPPDLCNKCLKCVRSCPVGALNADPAVTPRLDQPKCKTNYIRPFLWPTLWQTLKTVLGTEGAGNVGIQYIMEGYYFSCAECQKVCPRGELGPKM